ncbi:MAG: FHA domain-containing protein [Nannocystaceae bacterium]
MGPDLRRGVTQPMHTLRHDVDQLERAFQAVLPAVEGAASPACLLVRTDAGETESIPLERAVMLIGRSRLADVHRHDPTMALQHAKLVAQGSRHWLHDLGKSRNGTLVNGERVSEVQLREGDTIQIGNSLFTYRAAFQPLERMPHASRQAQMVSMVRGMPAVGGAPYAAPGGSADDERVDLQQIVAKVRRFAAFFRYYWRLVALCVLLGAGSGFAFVVNRPLLSVAAFKISLIPDATVNPLQRGRQTVTFFSAPKEGFRNPDLVAESVRKAYGQEPDEGEVKNAIANLEFRRVGQDLWEGGYSSRDGPDLTLAFLASHVEGYVDREIDKTLTGLNKQVSSMREVLDDTNRELRRISEKQERFQREHTGALPSHGDHLGRLDELRARKLELTTGLERIGFELELAQSLLHSDDSLVGSRMEIVRPLQTTRRGVERQLTAAKARNLGQDHPDVVGLVAELEVIKREIKHELDRKPTAEERKLNPELREARATVRRLSMEKRVASGELQSVVGAMARLGEVVDELPGLETQATELERSAHAKRVHHDRVMQRYDTAKLQLRLERDAAEGRYHMVTKPHVLPVSRYRKLVLFTLMGAALGLVLGVAAALVRQVAHYVVLRA